MLDGTPLLDMCATGLPERSVDVALLHDIRARSAIRLVVGIHSPFRRGQGAMPVSLSRSSSTDATTWHSERQGN